MKAYIVKLFRFKPRSNRYVIYRYEGLFGLALMILMSVFFPKAIALEVLDYENRSIKLDQPAKRIIALSPHITENLFYAGLGDRIVGVSAYSDYPLQAKTLAVVSSYNSFNIEAIIALKPDLLVFWQSGGNQRLRASLDRFNLPYYVDEPRTLNDIARSIRDFTILGGISDIDEKANTFLRQIEQIKAKYAGAKPVRYFYQVWHQPLQTVNNQHLISHAIRLCGGENSFGDLTILAPIISAEALVQADPDVLISRGEASLNLPEHLNIKRIRLKYGLERQTTRILLGIREVCENFERYRQMN